MLSVATNSTTVDAADFAQIDTASNSLVLSSSNIDIMGPYIMKISAHEPRRGATKDVLFNLTIDCKVTKVFVSDEEVLKTSFIYYLGAYPYEIPLPKHETLPAGCHKPLKLSLSVLDINGMQIRNTSALPSFISLDADKGVIKLYGNNMYEAKKTYKFLLAALEPKSKIGDKNPYVFTV
jgi:hypothetical protein